MNTHALFHTTAVCRLAKLQTGLGLQFDIVPSGVWELMCRVTAVSSTWWSGWALVGILYQQVNHVYMLQLPVKQNKKEKAIQPMERMVLKTDDVWPPGSFMLLSLKHRSNLLRSIPDSLPEAGCTASKLPRCSITLVCIDRASMAKVVHKFLVSIWTLPEVWVNSGCHALSTSRPAIPSNTRIAHW